MFLSLLFIYLTVSLVSAEKCTGAEKGCAILYTERECAYPKYYLEDGNSNPGLKYTGNERTYSGNRLSAQYYPVHAKGITPKYISSSFRNGFGTMQLSCTLNEDHGPDDNCRFSLILKAILSIIGIAFAILMCVFCVR
ncbi:hypothetical protein PRIPAC_94432, partial [Pristionchus pacificus]|uniref:Uncharacterized protein n=1 Tax=Pristionchus pacificus TaxID=54126 RepID=A0A2A6BQZ8_PRIPA